MFLILAAGKASEAEIVAGIFLILGTLIVCLIWNIIQGPAHYDVVIKGGAPYCPRCNRQVTYRRDYCRSCGYRFVSHGTTPEEAHQQQVRKALERQASILREMKREEQYQEQAERLAERKAKRKAERDQRREERKVYYLDKGINPGPLAWYHDLPDLAQAILLGVGAAAIPVSLLVLLFR